MGLAAKGNISWPALKAFNQERAVRTVRDAAERLGILRARLMTSEGRVQSPLDAGAEEGGQSTASLHTGVVVEQSNRTSDERIER